MFVKWPWENTYKKWFGMNWEIANILTTLILLFLASAGVVTAIFAIKKHHDIGGSSDQNKVDILKKERWKFIGWSILAFAFPVLWPLILGLIDKAGVGQITGGGSNNYLEIILEGFKWEFYLS